MHRRFLSAALLGLAFIGVSATSAHAQDVDWRALESFGIRRSDFNVPPRPAPAYAYPRHSYPSYSAPTYTPSNGVQRFGATVQGWMTSDTAMWAGKQVGQKCKFR